MIYLETERLILRDYREDDFNEYYRLKSDSKTMYYLQDIQLHTKEEAYDDFHKVLDDMSKVDRKFYFMHIELKDTYPEFWGKGYITEAFQRVLAYAFSDNNVYRVSTGCLADNIGSERVMQKCGLIKEAEHIDYEWHDGKMKTRLEYRLLKREWEKTAPSITY